MNNNFTQFHQMELPFDTESKIYKIYCCDEFECDCEIKFQSYNEMMEKEELGT